MPKGTSSVKKGQKHILTGGVINNSLGMVTNIFGLILGRYNISNSGVFIIINATAVGPTGSTMITFSNVKFNDPEGNLVDMDVIY